MVIREGLKPSTFAFVARCSIQLSYLILLLEVLPRVELGSQGFAVPQLTVRPKHRNWIKRMDSNHRHSGSEPDVLPTELLLKMVDGENFEISTLGLRDRRSSSELPVQKLLLVVRYKLVRTERVVV